MKDNMKKIKKYVKLIKFAAACATVAMAVYTLIPKSEKIKDIDTAALEHYTPEVVAEENQ